MLDLSPITNFNASEPSKQKENNDTLATINSTIRLLNLNDAVATEDGDLFYSSDSQDANIVDSEEDYSSESGDSISSIER